MNKIYKAFIYSTKVQDKKNNKTFDKWHMSFKGFNYELAFWKDCEAKLRTVMLQGKLKEPLDIAFAEDDYYAKDIYYNRNDGTKGSKTRIYLKDFAEISQGEFTKKTLDDITEEKEAKKVESNPSEVH